MNRMGRRRSALEARLSAGVIFDGDDTLWETMPLYTEAKGRFCDLMVAAGFDRGMAEERFEAIDHGYVERFGFSQARFPGEIEQRPLNELFPLPIV